MLRIAQALLMATALGWAMAAAAEDAAKIPLELNRLEQDGDTCRVYLLVKNPDASSMDAFKLDVVFFDKEGVIRNRLYVELGPLAARKTAVRLFDVPGSTCASCGSLLVNDVVTCADANGAKLDCLKRLELSSRTDAKLQY